jgi:miniconductance mechanosensitive channel
VQNFDKTIITVPTYALVNESFQNWKGMETARARQIKRALLIDVKSIKFLDKQMKEKLTALKPLKEYVESFENRENAVTNVSGPFFNVGALTNLGLFRYYSETFLRNHPLVDSSQIVMMRHRTTDSNGLPLQIYLYAKSIQTPAYENLQSEIFEHLYAIMDEFGLKAFQQPSGYDVLASRDLKN